MRAVNASLAAVLLGAAALLPLALPASAAGTKVTGKVWRVGEDDSGCYAATVGAGGMGITYSDEDRFLVYFSGNDENIVSAPPFVDLTIGDKRAHLPLQSIGGDGWTLDETADMDTVKQLAEEILKGTSGPLTVRSADAGIDMVFETAALQPFGPKFWACVKGQTPAE